MTSEELAIRIKAGETELMSTLWIQVEKFIRVQAGRFYFQHEGQCLRLCMDRDDLYQEGYFAIIRAVDDFEAERGLAFLTYAARKLKGRFNTALKLNTSRWDKDLTYYALSLDAPTRSDETTLADTLADSSSALVIDDVAERDFPNDSARTLRR